MEQVPGKPPKPHAPRVDYNTLRPLGKPTEMPGVVADRRLHELAFHMSKVPGEKRTAFAIFQELKAEEQKKKTQ